MIKLKIILNYLKIESRTKKRVLGNNNVQNKAPSGYAKFAAFLISKHVKSSRQP